MTIAFWCVLAAAAIPLLFVSYAKATPQFLSGDHNKKPREYEDNLEGARKRAHWAHLNAFEAFPSFAAAVIIAHIAGAPQSSVDTLALCFVGLRIAHGVFYIADLDKLRSLAFTGAFASTVGLFVVAAGAA